MLDAISVRMKTACGGIHYTAGINAMFVTSNLE